MAMVSLAFTFIACLLGQPLWLWDVSELRSALHTPAFDLLIFPIVSYCDVVRQAMGQLLQTTVQMQR